MEGALTPLVRCACRLADCLGFSVLQAPVAYTIPEVLAELPLRNPVQTAADLESAADRIRKALTTIVPTRA